MVLAATLAMFVPMALVHHSLCCSVVTIKYSYEKMKRYTYIGKSNLNKVSKFVVNYVHSLSIQSSIKVSVSFFSIIDKLVEVLMPFLLCPNFPVIDGMISNVAAW